MRPEIKERIEKINMGEVPEGYKKSAVGIIPNDWVIEKLSDINEVSTGSTPLRSTNKYYNGIIPWVKTMDLNNSNIYETEEKITKEALNETAVRLVKKNSILVAMYGGFNQIGRTGLMKIEGTTNQALASLYVDETNYCSEFVLHWLNAKRGLWKRFAASSRKDPNITKRDVEDFPIISLNYQEQKKIAVILSTWDKAIELKEKLIEQKKEQKKWLMQKLLTGKMRLLGFERPWAKLMLGDLGKTFNGLTGKSKDDFGFGKPYIPYKNIFSNPRLDTSYIDYVDINKNENQSRVKYGDIFFTVSSEIPEEVGITSVLLDEMDELYLNSFCFGFRLNNIETLLPEFARFYFRGSDFRNKIIKLAQGSTRFNLSKTEVLKIRVKLPQIEEQESISKVLDNLESEIQLLEKELAAQKKQKKGLMQLLLTGKVRVKC